MQLPTVDDVDAVGRMAAFVVAAPSHTSPARRPRARSLTRPGWLHGLRAAPRGLPAHHRRHRLLHRDHGRSRLPAAFSGDAPDLRGGGRCAARLGLDRPDPAEDRHIAANPYVSCSYWSPAQDTVAIDCAADWVEDADLLRQVWDIFAAPDPPGWGYLSGYGEAGTSHPDSTSFGFSRIASRSCSATSSPRVTSRLGRGGALIGSRLDASRTESALRWFAGRSGPGTSLAQRTWSTGNAV